MNMLELIGYEYKKMFKRKSFWLNLAAGLLIMLFSGSIMALGNIYVEGEQACSAAEYLQAERRAGEALNGTILDEENLLQAQKLWNERAGLVPGRDITAGNYLEITERYYLGTAAAQMGKWPEYVTDAQEFYRDRKERQKIEWDGLGLSPKETESLARMDEKIKTPWEYGYNRAYSRFETLQLTNILILSLLIAICLAPIFTEEYTTNMDALILSSKNGRGKIITAKFLTGLSFSIILGIIGYGAALLEQVLLYGPGMLSVPMQVLTNMTESPYPFTVGGMLAVTLACSILVSVFMAVIIMCCSANMKSSFGPAVTGILLAFLPLFKNVIPKSCRGLTMIAQALPGSFGEIHSVFADQLLQIGNLMLPAYIYVPVCYLILGTAMAVFMGRGYLKRE